LACATVFTWAACAGRCLDEAFAEGRAVRGAGAAGVDAMVLTVVAGRLGWMAAAEFIICLEPPASEKPKTTAAATTSRTGTSTSPKRRRAAVPS
jgi:hypothetical protein